MGVCARVFTLVVCGASLAAGASGQDSPPTQASPPARAPVVVSLTVGSLGFGDLQTQPVQADRLDEQGLVTDSATLERTIGMRGGFRVNASAAVAMGRSWAARLGATVGRGEVSQTFAGDDVWVRDAAAVPVEGTTRVSVTGIESALRFRVPSVHVFRPYLEVGIAVERWQSQGAAASPFPGAAALAGPLTRVGAHAALGGDYPITDRLAARLQASTRFQRTPLAPLPGGHELARTDTLVLTTLAPPAGPFADAAREHLASIRLELGLSYGLGGVTAVRRDPPESDESPSVPDR